MERQEEQSLAGKVAIITGASRGLGRHVALYLARCGVKLVVSARSIDAEGAAPGTINATVEEVRNLGGEAIAVAADMSQVSDLQRIVQTALEAFGGVDILINNAAVTHSDHWSSPLLEIPREEWLYQFDVNIHAPFTLTQLVLPSMEARGGGRIINITAGSAEAYRQPAESRFRESIGDFRMSAPAYFATKRALDRFSNVVAPELERKNVAIISVMPGLVASEVTVRNVAAAGLDDSAMVSMDLPARLIKYFLAAENPLAYTGQIFWPERDLKLLGLDA